MTTINQDFAALPNTSPFTAFASGMEILAGTFRIIDGVLTPASQDNYSIIRMEDEPSSGLMRIDFKISNTNAMYGDDVSALFIDREGNGVGVTIEGDRFYIRPFAEFSQGYYTHAAGNVYAAGSEFFATYDLSTHEIEFYQKSVSESEPVVSYTVPSEDVVPDLAPAISVNWYSTGLGGVIEYSISADTASINDLAELLSQGKTYTCSTTGLDEWASVTLGSKTLTFVDGESITLPAWTNGYVESLNLDSGYTLTITDINDLTATITVTYSSPAGYTHNQMGAGMTIDTGEQSIGKDPAIIAGTEVFPPPLDGGTMNNAGQFAGVPFGTYPGFWLRNLDLEMWEFTVVITEESVIVVPASAQKKRRYQAMLHTTYYRNRFR